MPRQPTATQPNPQETLGFRTGRSGVHAARTIMLDDLVRLFAQLPAETVPATYRAAIIDENDLAKPSKAARRYAYEYLHALYTLDPNVPLFRNLRRLWERDVAAQPLLALMAAYARDPLLRASAPWVLSLQPGDVLERQNTEARIRDAFPDRFSPVMCAGLAKRLNATWTQSGHLKGRVRKERARPVATPTNVAFGLFLGYLAGASGLPLLRTPWMALLDVPPGPDLDTLIRSAAHQELLVLRAAAGVMEVRFPDWLTPAELRAREEMARESA